MHQRCIMRVFSERLVASERFDIRARCEGVDDGEEVDAGIMGRSAVYEFLDRTRNDIGSRYGDGVVEIDFLKASAITHNDGRHGCVVAKA